MWGREEPGKWPAAILAVLVHLLFVGLLVFGVSWQNKPPAAVTAELWSSLPPAPAAVQQVVSRPEPRVVEPPPKEVPPEPKQKAEPKAEPKPPVEKPDIQLKEKEQKRQKEEKEQQEKQEKLERQKEEKRKQDKEKEKQQVQEQQARQAEQQRKEQAAASQVAQAGVQSRVNDYKGRIEGKIKRFIILPPDLSGNPQAEFDVVLLPSGDVLSVKLTRGSGNAAYDSAVERAIYKAQPLPLPPDSALFSAFRELHLKFRPQEDN